MVGQKNQKLIKKNPNQTYIPKLTTKSAKLRVLTLGVRNSNAIRCSFSSRSRQEKNWEKKK